MKQEKFLMRVDNNKEGRNLIHSLKRNLNSNSYRIVTRYSGPRPVGTSQISTSKENAKSLRVYVESKLPAANSIYNWEADRFLPKSGIKEVPVETVVDVEALADAVGNSESFAEVIKNTEWDVEQAKAEGRNAVLHEQVKIEKLEEEKKVLEAKLTLLTSGLQNSSKYGTFVQTVNSIDSINGRGK